MKKRLEKVCKLFGELEVDCGCSCNQVSYLGVGTF
jgi:hypothetical protein